MRPKISVVIIGKNEEKYIDDCLGSVSGWADEIVFVDDFSTDSTVEHVKKEKSAVILQRKMDMEGRHRNFAAQNAKNDWIMILDCDERATPEVKQEIDELFSRKDEKEVAFWVPGKNYLGDYWLRWGGWYPAPHIRLYNRKYFRWKESVHDIVHPGVEFIGEGYKKGDNLKNHLIHFNFLNIEDFIRKTNRMTTLEAIKWYLDGRDMSMARGLRRFADRFFRRYIRKQGYRDGFYGFIAGFLSGFYELAAYAKYREIVKKGYYIRENGITDQAIADSVRNQYQKPLKFRSIKKRFSVMPMVFKVILRNLRGRKVESELCFLKKILKYDDICLDIGSAYGRYAYEMSRIVKKGKVISFEPGQYSFFVLTAVKKIMGMKNVDIVKKALGNEEKESFLVSPVKPTGRIGHSLSYISDRVVFNAACEPIEITTIDNFFVDAGLGRLDFIKCDTEGAEMMIFSGAEGILKRHRPVVLAEIENGHLERFNSCARDVESFFSKLDYGIFQLENKQLLEKVNISEDSNYFFIPQEKVDKILKTSKASENNSL
jgi:FkbM family methyltransferase